MKKKRKPVGVHPFVKQAARAKWNAEAVTAQIHALTGADRERLLAHGSVLFSVAAACAMYLGWTGDEPDMRIVRASVNALDDLAKRPTITDMDRGALMSGMQASARIIEVTPIEAVIEAALMYDEHSRAWGKK
ncbi:MAG: hypothetical protein K2Y15_04980 [Burkholderiaceae bacterium]|nr:hypothetical protein [Burkholderiaceae bacterium]